MPKQIGWSNESNLLYTISSQISRLAGIISTSGGGGGGTITGGGASGQVTFWNGATSITGSNNLFWDAAQNRLGIGTNVPATSAEIATSAGRLRFNQTVGGSIFHGIEFASSGAIYGSIIGNQNTGEIRLSNVASYFYTFYGGGTEGMRLTTNRNLIIQNGGTFTDDNTNRLQVSGNAKIVGSGATGTTFGLRVQNSNGNNIFSVRNDGSVFVEAVLGNAVLYMSDVGSTRFEKSVSTGITCLGPSTIDHTFSLSSFDSGNYSNGALSSLNLEGNYIPINGSTAFSYILLNGTINQTGTNTSIARGFYINPTITASPNWRSIEWSNNTGWGLYGAGTAPNYLGGDLIIAGVLRETVTTNRQTASYTLALTDRGKLVETNVGAANTITVPPNSSITFPIGTKIDIAQYGAGQTTIVPGIGVTVRSAGGALKLSAQYSGATIVKIGTDEWYLFGDITV
jgi:hypothetical protein